ncbi:MAG: hypothetical protein RID91_22810, partial [Azospirillaceae bacterium]
MKTPFAALALGTAAVAIGAGLPPVSALAAEGSVPGLLRCYQDGAETATIGPVFRIWQAGDTLPEPGPSADGCFWRPFTQVDVPGGRPPSSALAGSVPNVPPPPAPPAADPQAAPDGTAVARSPKVIEMPSAPEAAGLATTEGTATVAAGQPAAPPTSQAARIMPIDRAVAAELASAPRAVDILPLEPLAMVDAPAETAAPVAVAVTPPDALYPAAEP